MVQQVHSPLFMAMHDPVLHRFISFLAQKKAEQEHLPEADVRIELSRDLIMQVRESFRQNILDGERYLHSLSHILASVLLGDFELHSNVIGVLPGDEERPFLIRERINQETLFSVLDIDLGNQMLDNFRYRKDSAWVPLELSANFVEYIPAGRPEGGINRLTSRVKAEEELWNKVVDELFHVDQILSRDKHLRQYSKYIKDIFGIKIVCDDDETCLRLHDRLHLIRNDDVDWNALKVLQNSAVELKPHYGDQVLLEFVETKNYLTCAASEMKKTGWRAMKSVVTWQDRLFEIQVQPLSNYYLELDHMSGPSHRSFKARRDAMRDELATMVPLYGLYRDLLRMLFMEADPSFENQTKASVVIK